MRSLANDQHEGAGEALSNHQKDPNKMAAETVYDTSAIRHVAGQGEYHAGIWMSKEKLKTKFFEVFDHGRSCLVGVEFNTFEQFWQKFLETVK